MIFCDDLILQIQLKFAKIYKNFLSREKKPLKNIYLTFAVGTSCCNDNHRTQAIKTSEIDISSYDIQENHKTKL